VLVLADFATILLGRAWHGLPLNDAKDVLRPDLLALMGISAASAVATSILHANKSGMQTPAGALQCAKNHLNDFSGTFTDAQGVLYRNKHMSDAQINDMFEGDELCDAHTADLGKVQMFFFTVVSAVVFVGAAQATLANAKSLAEVLIPQLPQNLIALMGISHAAYVSNKAVTRTQGQVGVESQPQVQQQIVPADPQIPIKPNPPPQGPVPPTPPSF
jgi:hypothetical protein